MNGLNEVPALARLAEIDGLFAFEALEKIGGTDESFVKTVRVAARLMPEAAFKMDRALLETGNPDMDTFRIEAHGLTGSLKTIGHFALGEAAAALERMAIDGDAGACRALYPEFRAGLLGFCEQVSAAFAAPPETPKEPGDASALKDALLRARALADDFDTVAALDGLAPFARQSFPPKISAMLTDIINALEIFDCETAIEIMTRLCDESGGL